MIDAINPYDVFPQLQANFENKSKEPAIEVSSKDTKKGRSLFKVVIVSGFIIAITAYLFHRANEIKYNKEIKKGNDKFA